MKKMVLLILLSAVLAGAQQVPTQEGKPAYSDVYCSGFITNQLLPLTHYVAGGWESPHATRFADREYIYLDGGGFQVGAQYSIHRMVRDPNRWPAFKGQRQAIAAVGEMYADVGRVQIVAVRGSIGIAQVMLACDGIAPGDVAVPFQERSVPALRLTTGAGFDRFAEPNGLLSGRIVGSRDFDSVVGTGHKVYLNVGANQGVKPGDYFRAVRDYRIASMNEVDALSYKASVADDTQKNPPKFPKTRLGDLPRRSLGEMVVLSASPSSATAMVTFALESIEVGDLVEMMEPLPPPPPPVMNPPTAACTASPATVVVGERSTISCEASSPDDRPLSISFSASAGSLITRDEGAALDTQGASPGTITVACTATDDRNLTGTGSCTVNVEAIPPAPEAAKTNECGFKKNSARVDNACKAMLDDLALRLQGDPQSTASIIGFAEAGERRADRLAAQRAENTRTYLTRDKGIDPSRVQVKSNAEGGSKADLWQIPAGATLPQ
ncbi:MAG: OmpA family protein [Acidobacteria bacterium]|nr:OmpA family protein [Acidobacteriota bacterium]